MPDVTITHTGVRGVPLFAGTVDFVQPLRSSMLAVVYLPIPR